jgi:hypothetical protein
MTRILLLAVILLSLPASLAAQFGIYQHGTVVRMHMGDCATAHRGFMTNFGNPAGQAPEGSCPEYTLVSDKVVYVIVGKASNQLVPLAEVIDFRLHNNELAVRVDDAKHESKFVIREMTLRSQWELIQKHMEEELNRQPHPQDTALVLKNRE